MCGTTTLFWKDLWSNQLNDEAFPRAFSFTKLEDASVADFLAITNIHTGFHLPLTPLARQELQQLQAQTTHTIPDGDKPDQWTYSWGAKYTSARYYKFFFRNVLADPAFSWIWDSKCTTKIKVFAWLLLADRVNTRNMLKRRQYNIGNNVNCAICSCNVEETVEHLFFTCPFSQRCWRKVGMSWPGGANRLAFLAWGER